MRVTDGLTQTANCERRTPHLYPVLPTFFQLGYRHLTDAGAWDHQLFLLTIALAYAPVLWRKWIVLATVFAIGHTAAIVCLAAGLLPMGMTWVEPAIAASIVVLALVDLGFLQADPYDLRFGRWKYLLTLLLVEAFGVVHGLGFGGAFLSILGDGQGAGELLQMLIAFTLGVEVAQLLILFGLWVITYAAFEMLQWRPLLLRKLLLVLVAALGLRILLGFL